MITTDRQTLTPPSMKESRFALVDPSALAGQVETFSERPPTPKQTGADPIYPYYAGYADKFVEAMIRRLPSDDGVILDPWNGAGTTTSVAAQQGVSSIGVDLNPVASLIARARLLPSSVASSLEPIAEEILANRGSGGGLPDEPLNAWFERKSAARCRILERSIFRVTAMGDDATLITELAEDQISSLTAVLYLGLFASIRDLIGRFRSSNPTWIRGFRAGDRRIRVTAERVEETFRARVKILANELGGAGLQPASNTTALIRTACSDSLPLAADQVDAVITSPPYCTRIDYVIGTGPELAAIGVDAEQIRELREKMVGTALMLHEEEESILGSSDATSLLRRIGAHPSHGAERYYEPFFRQYFQAMSRSMIEINRVAKPASPIVFVVQDSYFKDIHIDLARILDQMAGNIGWGSVADHAFQVKTRAAQNPRARQYARLPHATESVLIFSTGARS